LRAKQHGIQVLDRVQFLIRTLKDASDALIVRSVRIRSTFGVHPPDDKNRHVTGVRAFKF
jgi:hypothetical protein